jgi:hypothetical protein
MLESIISFGLTNVRKPGLVFSLPRAALTVVTVQHLCSLALLE